MSKYTRAYTRAWLEGLDAAERHFCGLGEPKHREKRYGGLPLEVNRCPYERGTEEFDHWWAGHSAWYSGTRVPQTEREDS